jgi:hypothetical protein
MNVGDPRRRYPTITVELLEQLVAVEPSIDASVTDLTLEYRACSVRLLDGSIDDRVLVQESRPWIDIWGVWPDEDPGKREVSIRDVAEIASSPLRLPPRLATKMYAAGEPGMGYCVFTLVLADGRRIPRATGGVVDFVELPPGVRPDNVVDLLPHDGDTAQASDHSGDYAWCLYERPGAG